jgi:hypothetical protein
VGSFGPDINVLFGWWGGTSYASTINLAAISQAANVGPFVYGKFQASDFLQWYPQFGSSQQGVATATIASGGTGYAVNDVVNLLQSDASGATLTVASVSAGGAVTAFAVTNAGTGYSVADGLSTAAIAPSAGQGLTVNVTLITPTALNFVPPFVLNMYCVIASNSLSPERWGALWPQAMALYVAHYATLYLMAIGGNGTASALAASGLAGGIITSDAAGDVSESYTPPPGLEDAGAWSLTSFGQQLFTLSKTIGMGMILAFGD